MDSQRAVTVGFMLCNHHTQTARPAGLPSHYRSITIAEYLRRELHLCIPYATTLNTSVSFLRGFDAPVCV